MNVIVIGSGLAGSLVATNLQDSHKVTLLTKGGATNNNSALAQGGIAVALGTSDTAHQHRIDTIAAGCNVNDPKIVEILTSSGIQDVQELIAQGMQFDTDDSGGLAFGLEGAHSRRRIIHAGGDTTGKCLLNFVQSKLSKVKLMENSYVVELLRDRATNHVQGVRFLNADNQQMVQFADVVVLATGGIGHLYDFSANDITITGDGIALAKRAGATLKDMQFIQFHPTILNVQDLQPPMLISEAIRGQGAQLVNELGDNFMSKVHALGDLAPRNVVTRAIHNQQVAGHKIYLDISQIADFSKRFPTIWAVLQQHQLTELVPVRPGAHFIMGGVHTDDSGRTDVPALYAVGEVATTGVHGANRLASNSLLECIVMAKRVANAIKQDNYHLPNVVTPWQPLSNHQVPQVEIGQLRQMISEHIGIVRHRRKLVDFLKYLSQFNVNPIIPDIVASQGQNAVLVAREIAKASLLHPNSIGAHYII